MAELESVSIHAPAQGATGRSMRSVCMDAVSIHAPAQGATPKYYLSARACRGFNPRSRTGSDSLAKEAMSRLGGFNPRSRTGSDPAAMRAPSALRGFNPRSRTGSDPARFTPSHVSATFQSTLPHRERRSARC
ncbi:conserved hypothetical protein [Gluconacetobacter diazotrophicus PA1 5]|nr:conserved hypothetical protein [Gluconacetobacter diazotrophicus PA1 5]